MRLLPIYEIEGKQVVGEGGACADAAQTVAAFRDGKLALGNDGHYYVEGEYFWRPVSRGLLTRLGILEFPNSKIPTVYLRCVREGGRRGAA